MFGMKEIDSHALAERLQADPESVHVIDVRSPQETAQGVIPGAECVPLHLVPLMLEQWHRIERPIVLYCRSGARSAQAAGFLLSNGLKNEIYNLRSGIIGWAGAGFHIAAPAAENA